MVRPVQPPEKTTVRDEKRPKLKRLLAGCAGLLALLLVLSSLPKSQTRHFVPTRDSTPPLVMVGGDPYLRALMRTISASEANDSDPYSIIYGGDHVSDLSRHPERCVPIVTGPNVGNCSTAAGRYQFINTTWAEKAQRYHPHPDQFLFWKFYSFEPEYQDAVLYGWLSDRAFWGMDISESLRQGKLNQVLKRLSGTWTSLGYGIEDNDITGRLPKIYQQMLKEELGKMPK